VLEKEMMCLSLTQPPWDAGHSSQIEISKVSIPGTHSRPFTGSKMLSTQSYTRRCREEAML